ncbi:MAG: GtrA family protein [Candidatus Competibacteraceae bacterium]
MTLVGRLLDARFLRFIATGVVNTAFGYSVYGVLVFLGLPYPLALALATVAGVAFNYRTFGRFVFASSGGAKIFAKFLASYLVIYILNVLMLGSLLHFLHLDPYLSQLLCLVPTVVIGFLLMQSWVFRGEPKGETE